MRLLTVAAVLLAGCAEPVDERFLAEPTQRYYAIEFAGAVAGRIHESRRRRRDGSLEQTTITTVDLPGAGRLHLREHQRFAARSPHALVEHTRWRRTPDGHATTTRPPVADPAPTLADAMNQPGRPATAAPGAAMRRDDAGGVLEYRIGDRFLVRRVPELPDLPPVRAERPLALAVDDRRSAHSRITALQLRVRGPAAERFEDTPELRVTRGELGTMLAVTGGAAAEAELERRIAVVVDEVRTLLRYVPGSSGDDLRTLLLRGEGDCHEFALLFEALAERAGLDVERVSGLAWSPARDDAFVAHAWNRVRTDDGRWVVVDPTWARIAPGADRIPFPDDGAAALDLALDLRLSTLEIVDLSAAPAAARISSPSVGAP